MTISARASVRENRGPLTRLGCPLAPPLDVHKPDCLSNHALLPCAPHRRFQRAAIPLYGLPAPGAQSEPLRVGPLPFTECARRSNRHKSPERAAEMCLLLPRCVVYCIRHQRRCRPARPIGRGTTLSNRTTEPFTLDGCAAPWSGGRSGRLERTDGRRRARYGDDVGDEELSWRGV